MNIGLKGFARIFAISLFSLLIASTLVFATPSINQTAGFVFPSAYHNTSNITGITFTFNITNSTAPVTSFFYVNFTLQSNFSGTWANNITNASGYVHPAINNNVTFNLTGLSEGFFIWNIEVRVNATNSALSNFSTLRLSSNYTLIVDNTAPNLSEINSPANNLNHSSRSLVFNATGFDNILLQNVSVYHNATGTWHRNTTNASITSINNNSFLLVTVSDLPEASRFVANMEACDTSGRCAQLNSNRTLIVDLTAPNVTTSHMANHLNASSRSITFNVTVKDNVQLVNASIFHNATGTWHRNTTNSSLTAVQNNTVISVTVSDLPEATRFVWIMESCDVAGNCAQYNSNSTAIVDVSTPTVSAANSPANFHNSSSRSVTFNVTVKDNVQLANASIFHNATGTWHRNTTNSSLTAIHNNTWILVTVDSLPEANLSVWIAEACDVAGNCGQFSANRTFIIDLTRPHVRIVNFSKTSDTSAFLNISVNDFNVMNTTIVSLARASGTTNYTTLTLFPVSASNTSGFYNLSFTDLGYDTYTVYAYVNDSAGNANSTATSSLTIASSSTSGSSGGSGGGSGGFASSAFTPTPSPSATATVVPTATPTTPMATPAAEPSPSPRPSPSPVPTPVPEQVRQASQAISGASNALADARARGAEVSEAERVLELARQAQSQGNYALAAQYAEEALQAIQKTLEVSPEATTSPQAKAGAPLDLAVIGAVVLLVLAVAAWHFFLRSPASKK